MVTFGIAGKASSLISYFMVIPAVTPTSSPKVFGVTTGSATFFVPMTVSKGVSISNIAAKTIILFFNLKIISPNYRGFSNVSSSYLHLTNNKVPV